MAVSKGKFDSRLFYKSLDSVRLSKKLNWKEVAGEAGVQASTLTRMSQGKRPDVDTMAVLAGWSGLNPGDFIVSEYDATQEALGNTYLATITSSLHKDPNLDEASSQAIEILVKTAYEQMRKK